MEIQNEIKNHLEVIEKSLAWADLYKKETFNRKNFKDYRREVNRIRYALSENCAAAAYGESQVGKSYLMDSLLASPTKPFRIINKGQTYSFINEINSSGGNNSKVETTGVITRFTINEYNKTMRDFVRIKTLSVLDLVLLTADAYYNDVSRNDNELKSNDIDQYIIDSLPSWKSTSYHQDFITEDDIWEIQDYFTEHKLSNYVRDSRFFEKVASVISYIKPEHWGDLFSTLWNNNTHLKHLFQKIINEYQTIEFLDEVYVPFEAVLRSNGTLLKIEWLNKACGMDIDMGQDLPTTDVYDGFNRVVARSFDKAILSSLIAELTFCISPDNLEEKSFLKNIDLLDFPGARSREKLDENKFNNPEVLARIFRRGKVAYLFKKYSNAMLINSLLFCHHNDQKTVTELGRTINGWIASNIGESSKIRSRRLPQTHNISPFFLVATKFNIDLKRNVEVDKSTDSSRINEHWKRFDQVLPELINPSSWFDDWSNNQPFQSIYPLRDYFWSRETNLFDGFSNSPESPHGEDSLHIPEDYQNYFDILKQSFLDCPFVRLHFKDANKTWEEVATPNNDGSKAIIRDLNQLAPCLDDFRYEKYCDRLKEIRDEILKVLSLYYISDSDDEKNQRTKKIIATVRLKLELAVYGKQEILGNILESLMVKPEKLREISYDIIIRKTEVPKDFSKVSIIRAMVGLDPKNTREENLQKLSNYYGFEIEALDDMFKEENITIEDIVSGNSENLVTVADVLVKNIIEYWTNHINQAVQYIEKQISHAHEIIDCLQTLLRLLNVKEELIKKINGYQQIFSEDDLPNAIAAMAALVLNNFVSTCGRPYMTAEHLQSIRKKSDICSINFIDLTDAGLQLARPSQSVEDVLNTLTISEEIIRKNSGSPDNKKTLRKLPLYDNFIRWENFLIIALLLSSDVSNVDPLANGAMKNIIESCNRLYPTA